MSTSGVRWTCGSAVSVTSAARVPGRGCRSERLPCDPLRGSCDERSLGLEGQEVRRLVERHPADLLELVVVPREVAADGLHEEVMDRLVDPRPVLDEGVPDRLELTHDPDLQTALLGDLADGGLLAALAGLRRSLGQRPGDRIALAAAHADDQMRDPGLV